MIITRGTETTKIIKIERTENILIVNGTSNLYLYRYYHMSSSALIFLHGSGSSGANIRTFLETAPLAVLNHQTFRSVLDAGR
jgi:hypothetical protein